MKVDEIAQAQIRASGGQAEPTVSAIVAGSSSSLYPSLSDYLGLDLNEVNNALVSAHGSNTIAPAGSAWTSGSMDLSGNRVVAPVTGEDKAMQVASIKQGMRKIVLCKDNRGIIGMCVQSIDNGLFVSFVQRDTPAALGGLRFGDQIIEMNGSSVAGWSTDQGTKFLKKADGARVEMIIRDRPFERTITLNKDSSGQLGFEFKDNKIANIVQNSSAARNGILTDHYLTEVNGQNVIGLKDKEVAEIIALVPTTVTVTIIPTVIYKQITKKLDSSLIKKYMDHSLPTL